MLSTLASVIIASEEELAPLIAPAPVLGGVAALVFLMLGVVTFAYRDVANRHSNKTGSSSSGHDTGH
jgi:xanthine/uracil permease